MAEKAETDLSQRIETEARKVPPLPYVLFLCAVATCPFWISVAVVVVAENLSNSLPDNFYVAVRWSITGGMLLSLWPFWQLQLWACSSGRGCGKKIGFGDRK